MAAHCPPKGSMEDLRLQVRSLKKANKELEEAYRNKFKAYIELANKMRKLEKKLSG